MKRVLYPDELSASPAPDSSADDLLPDFRRWLTTVQAGLRAEAARGGAQPATPDHSPDQPGGSPKYSPQDAAPDQTL